MIQLLHAIVWCDLLLSVEMFLDKLSCTHSLIFSSPPLFFLSGIFISFVYFWDCGIFRGALTCRRTSVCPGYAAHARWHPRLATCIWPRSLVWTLTGHQSQPPLLKQSPAQKTAPPIKSWSTPSIHNTPPRIHYPLHTWDMTMTHVLVNTHSTYSYEGVTGYLLVTVQKLASNTVVPQTLLQKQ